jgi:hypothetical protein
MMTMTITLLILRLPVRKESTESKVPSIVIVAGGVESAILCVSGNHTMKTISNR